MGNFKKNDNSFICLNCGANVPRLGYTSRDHCNVCLHSLHVDIIPGDRENECKGTLVPVQTLPDAKRGFIIIYKCSKCGAEIRNVAARDDDTELLIKLTAKQ